MSYQDRMTLWKAAIAIPFIFVMFAVLIFGCMTVSDDWVQTAFCNASWFLTPECW